MPLCLRFEKKNKRGCIEIYRYDFNLILYNKRDFFKVDMLRKVGKFGTYART